MKVTSILSRESRFPVPVVRPKFSAIDHERMAYVCKRIKENLAQGCNSRSIMPRRTYLRAELLRRVCVRYNIDTFVCRDCGEVFIYDHQRYSVRQARVCENCIDDWVCTEDNGWMSREEAFYSDRQDAWYSYDYDADYCSDDDDDDSYPYDYHSHPHRAHKNAITPYADDPLKSDVLRLGIEWEYESYDAESDAGKVDATAYAFAERDGSLDSQYGLEIVTGYSTIPTVTRWIHELHSMMDFRSLDEAGLHVNISGLSRMAAAKFITFLNRPGNLNFLTEIAGRCDVLYARQQHSNLGDWCRAWRRSSCAPGTNKYSHVNVHDRYLEVRVFKSADDPVTIAARTQFVWALAKFCSDPGMTLDFDAFKAWLYRNPWAGKHCHDLFRYVPELRPKNFSKLKERV